MEVVSGYSKPGPGVIESRRNNSLVSENLIKKVIELRIGWFAYQRCAHGQVDS